MSTSKGARQRAVPTAWATVGLALLAIWWCTTAQAQDGPRTVVGVASVTQARLSQALELPAEIRPRRRVQLSTEVAGLVAEVLVDEGDQVGADQPLLRLRTTPAELTLAAAKADLARARAQRELARLREKRQASLVQARVASTEQHDISAAELRVASAAVARAQAEVALLEDRLGRHLLRAPFPCVVRRKLAEAGSWLTTGSPALELDETGVVRVVVALPQAYYEKVRVGDEALLLPDGGGQRQLGAKVTQKIASGSAAARTFPVFLDLPDQQGQLLPGMSARVKLTLQSGGDAKALLVPKDALVTRPDGSHLLWVLTAAPQGLAVAPVPVIPTVSQDDRVAVTPQSAGGLDPGDRVVVRGNERLRPGQAVVLEPDSPGS